MIPASVTKIDPIYFEFDTNNGNQPVTIVFNCKASVLSNVKLIEVNSPAIESVIYVPEDEYGDKLWCGQHTDTSSVIVSEKFNDKTSDTVWKQVVPGNRSAVLCFSCVKDQSYCD